MSKIEWTNKTWNPVTGCTKVSQGCKNCYAERMYERFHGSGSFKTVQCHQDRLAIPMGWKKPQMVFVNSMSDLFHEQVPFEFIAAVFSVMSDIRIHTYQVLTKRPDRMIDFFNWKKEQNGAIPWIPSANVWIGVSVEDQKTADERIPKLLQVPASVRFLSCEPMLGEVDIASEVIVEKLLSTGVNTDGYAGIDWIICGGESGPSARPMHPNWARKLRDSCEVYGIAFFFKQWGAYGPHPGIFYHKHPYKFSDGTIVYKASKEQNGRMLDGVFHENYPTNLYP